MQTSHPGIKSYVDRHIGPAENNRALMLREIGVKSLDDLIQQTVPENIRTELPALPAPMSEFDYLQHVRNISQKNKVFKSYLGQGFYNTITPSVIQRNIFENPGWYTQYTPYQAEISQGRLEALLNFQTMISDLTGLELANASLLDEATAAAEAMAMLHRVRAKSKIKANSNVFFVSDTVLQTTIDVLQTRADPLGIKLVFGDISSIKFTDEIFGALLQFPAHDGLVFDYADFIKTAHANDCKVVVAADLMSLVLFTPPGELGADVAVGSTQRFGVPLGFGGPHAAYFATRNEYKRQTPGRIIGVSVDRLGKVGYRMALQTREQHIRREKATSNICTAQALLAIMAGMYAVYHGPKGLEAIAEDIQNKTRNLASQLAQLGAKQLNEAFFDTLKIEMSKDEASKIKNLSQERGINFRSIGDKRIGISLDETTSYSDVQQIVEIFAKALGTKIEKNASSASNTMPNSKNRSSKFLQHAVFNSYYSETQMMRYIKSLEDKDLSLTKSMIPLGSCTMKLNPATAMYPVSWPEFGSIHPFAPESQTEGYRQIINELADYLNKITGFAATSFQPNSGAQGEFAGMRLIRAYQADQGEGHRNVVLIPTSAHGTNPASAIMAGAKIVLVNCDDHGNVDLAELRAKAEEHCDSLSALMITYPSTHGVFEAQIIEMCDIIHNNGGQVYMDGANMNAQVGLTSPAKIGADVCHLNLHKTFSIPHGGGGPGVGPVCVAAHLAPYLPGHSVIKTGGDKAISAVSNAPFGSASILLIPYAYIRMLGLEGMTDATKNAILNANYIKSRLEKYYPVLYAGERGRAAHELILDMRQFKTTADIEVEDIAKRLMDYGFHAPTVAFPVHGTLMVEPTESEPLEELDRFCNAMIAIYGEIKKIESGDADKTDNVLKNAPHTVEEAVADEWPHPYSRTQALFPLAEVKTHKFWPAVARIDNTYGDRNLVCACPPIESYEE